jgi:hypothetical protein
LRLLRLLSATSFCPRGGALPSLMSVSEARLDELASAGVGCPRLLAPKDPLGLPAFLADSLSPITCRRLFALHRAPDSSSFEPSDSCIYQDGFIRPNKQPARAALATIISGGGRL